MTTTDPRHVDVAAYALGVLDTVDTEAFEFHLVWCGTCAGELERLLPTAAALAQVDVDAFVQAEQAGRDARMLDDMLNVVALHRRRAVVTRTLAVAACIALLVVVAIVASPSVIGHDQAPKALPKASRSDAAVGAQASPSNQPALTSNPPGIAGEQFSATDPVTKARLEAIVTSLPWGTQMTISLSQVTGPLECELYAVDRAGVSTVIASWHIDQHGYGTTANPDPLLLIASTSAVRTEIERIFVRSQPPNGPAGVLVSVPL